MDLLQEVLERMKKKKADLEKLSPQEKQRLKEIEAEKLKILKEAASKIHKNN